MNKHKKTISYYIAIIIGLILLLCSIIVETSCAKIYNETFKWLIMLLSKMLSTVGLSLSVSGIMVRIDKSDVIESALSSSEKISMIKEVLKRETNLDNFLEEKTKELYNIENRYFTNYNIKIEVGQENDKIVAKSIVTYFDNSRTKKDKKISAYYAKPQDRVDKIIVINPDDTSRHKEFSGDEILHKESDEYGVYKNEFFVNLPEEFLLDTIKIRKETTSYGYDHWIDVGTIFARPTRGVQINVVLKDGLMIKDEFVACNSKQYEIVKTDNSYTFTNLGWISSYCGICLLIAKKQIDEK